MWSIGHGTGGTFGAFQIADAHAGSCLRDRLRRMARGEGQRPFSELRLDRHEPKLLWFGELASDDKLPDVLVSDNDFSVFGPQNITMWL